MNFSHFEFKLQVGEELQTYQWDNGLEEAKSRLKEHLQNPALRLDSRDRAALAYMLWSLEPKILDAQEVLEHKAMLYDAIIQAEFSVPKD